MGWALRKGNCSLCCLPLPYIWGIRKIKKGKDDRDASQGAPVHSVAKGGKACVRLRSTIAPVRLRSFRRARRRRRQDDGDEGERNGSMSHPRDLGRVEANRYQYRSSEIDSEPIWEL
eukprot:8520492-Pyramimonas_sp.AAC.1